MIRDVAAAAAAVSRMGRKGDEINMGDCGSHKARLLLVLDFHERRREEHRMGDVMCTTDPSDRAVVAVD